MTEGDLKKPAVKLRASKVIKTKSICGSKEYGDGPRVLITRYYPRGVKKTHFDRWMREPAPSRELLRRYKNGQSQLGGSCAAIQARAAGEPKQHQYHQVTEGRIRTFPCNSAVL